MQSTTDDHAHFRDSVFNASHKHAMLESPPAYKEYSSHISLNNNQLFASFTYMWTLIATRTFLFGIDGLHSVHNLNQRFFLWFSSDYHFSNGSVAPATIFSSYHRDYWPAQILLYNHLCVYWEGSGNKLRCTDQVIGAGNVRNCRPHCFINFYNYWAMHEKLVHWFGNNELRSIQ